METWPDRIADEAMLEEVMSRPDPALVGRPGRRAGRHPGARRRRARWGRPSAAWRSAPIPRGASSPWRAGPSPDCASAWKPGASNASRADLTDRAALAALPDAPNVVFMAARKFGSTGSEALTWAMNVLLPAMVAERWAASRIVFFSHRQRAAAGAGAVRRRRRGRRRPPRSATTPPSCLGRERVFQHAAATRGTPCFGIRLNYAIDLRYGVLHDIATKVRGRRSRCRWPWAMPT